jgi:pimeloyl-ACP methyl ester carboxylesterase
MQPGFFDGLKDASIEVMPQMLQDEFLKINPDRNKLLTMFNKDKERMMQFVDWKDELISSIKARTLIINGDQDITLPGHAVAMSNLIENSKLVILPANHGSYIGAEEIPNPDTKIIELTVEIIKDFLNKQ